MGRIGGMDTIADRPHQLRQPLQPFLPIQPFPPHLPHLGTGDWGLIDGSLLHLLLRREGEPFVDLAALGHEPGDVLAHRWTVLEAVT